MSDDKLDLKLNVDIEVNDAERLAAVRKEMELINREIRNSASKASHSDAVAGVRDHLAELKKVWTFQRRMRAQEKTEANEAARAAKAEADAIDQRFKEQMSFNSRMVAQRLREERAAETAIQKEVRETARMRDRAAMQARNDLKALQREQERNAARVASGAGRARQGVGRAVTAGGATAAASAYAANRVVGDLTRSGVSLDKALNQNTRLSGLSPKDAEAQGQALLKKVSPIARQLGIKTAEYLAARAETIQAGVSEELVDSVTEYGSKFARLNDMAPSEVMESSGYGITALGAFGKVTADKVKQLFNVQQHLAATTAASRQGLSSFVRRGLSAGAAAGFDVNDTLAYGAAATSSGADGESAARMLSSTTERLASMPTRAAGIARKKHRSPKDALILALPGKLGFKSWSDLKAAFSKDSAGSIEKIYEGLAAITDPRARLEASEEIWGKEFGSVHAAMAVGHRFRDMRKSVRSKEAGSAIDSGMAIRSGSFDFIMDQIGSTFQSLKDGLGMQLKPFWRDLRDWAILTPKAFESFDAAFAEGMKGFVSGLGSPDGTMAGLLKSWFGDPGSFTVNARAIGDFARGIGAGLREIGSAIANFVRLFAGKNASPEELGKWTARILGLSAALFVAAPAVALAGGLITAISGVSTAIIGAWKLLQGAGIIGGGATTTSKLAGGALAEGGFMGAIGRMLGIAAFTPTAGQSKADTNRLIGRLGGYAQSLENAKRQAVAPETPTVDRLQAILGEQTQILGDQLRVQREALQLDKARDLANRVRKPGGAGGQFLDSVHNPGPLNGSIGNGSGGSGGGGGSGSGGAGGAGGVPALPDSVPMTPQERNQLGLIMQHETGGRNVMNGVGAKAGVSPTAARGYTAQGYYQILNSNWRRIAPKLGINTPNAMASSFEEQTRVAHYLLRHGGIQNWSNFNPKLRAALARGDQAQFAPSAQAGGGGAGDASGPIDQTGAGGSKPRLAGQIDVEGQKYDYGSGGHGGANSIPVGTYPITPNAIGDWGRRHGAIGLNGNAIWDRTLGRMRTGIELHAASSASKLTAGCLGIAKEQWGRFKAHVLEVIRKNGQAYLTVGADGRASISATAEAVKKNVEGTRQLDEEISKPPAAVAPQAQGQDKSDDLVDRHSGDPGGNIARTMPNKMGAGVPLRGAGQRMMSGGGGGGGNSIHAPITIHAGGQDPKAIASQVQRHLNDSMNRRGHDFEATYA